jgi:PEP-CTERM motif
MQVTSSSRRVSGLTMGMLLGAAFVPSAKGANILVDWGNANSFRGVTAPSPDSNGNHWNSFAPGAFDSNLIDRTGAATGINIGWDTPVGTDSYNGPAGATSFPPTATDVANAAAVINNPASQAALGDLAVPESIIDFAASGGVVEQDCVFDIENLNPNQTYTLRLFGSHIFSNNQQTTYSAYSHFDASIGNPSSQSVLPQPHEALSGLQASQSIDVQEINTADPSNPPNVPNSTQVAVLSGLVPNSDGIVFIDFVGAQGSLGYLNDMEIIPSAAPEPATLGLGALGLLLVARRRR